MYIPRRLPQAPIAGILPQGGDDALQLVGPGQFEKHIFKVFRPRRRLRPQFLDTPGDGEAAVLDDADPVAQFLGDLHRMGGEKDRRPPGRQGFEQLLDDPCALRVEPDHRFVDDDQRLVEHEDRGHDQFLAHAVGIALDQVVAPVAEVEQFEVAAGRRQDLVGGVIAVEAGDEAQVFIAGQFFIEEGAVGDVAGEPFALEGGAGEVVAADRHCPG